MTLNRNSKFYKFLKTFNHELKYSHHVSTDTCSLFGYIFISALCSWLIFVVSLLVCFLVGDSLAWYAAMIVNWSYITPNPQAYVFTLLFVVSLIFGGSWLAKEYLEDTIDDSILIQTISSKMHKFCRGIDIVEGDK